MKSVIAIRALSNGKCLSIVNNASTISSLSVAFKRQTLSPQNSKHRVAIIGHVLRILFSMKIQPHSIPLKCRGIIFHLSSRDSINNKLMNLKQSHLKSTSEQSYLQVTINQLRKPIYNCSKTKNGAPRNGSNFRKKRKYRLNTALISKYLSTSNKEMKTCKFSFRKF